MFARVQHLAARIACPLSRGRKGFIENFEDTVEGGFVMLYRGIFNAIIVHVIILGSSCVIYVFGVCSFHEVSYESTRIQDIHGKGEASE